MTSIDILYTGDCVDLMKNNIDNNSIQLTVTSPPYDNMRDYKGYVFDFENIVKELYRVTKIGGVVVWVVGDEVVDGSETLTSFKQALYFKEYGFKVHDTMIFEKTGINYPSQKRYNQFFEYMFVFSKGSPSVFNPICDIPKKWGGSWGKTKLRKKDGSLQERVVGNEGMAKSGRANIYECPHCGVEIYENLYINKNADSGKTEEINYGSKMRGNIWKIINSKKFAHKDEIAWRHPATFPEALARDHIITWSNENDIVLDPMCGSGTTCKMAKILNRKFIGIDISTEYIEISKKRINI